MRRHRSSVVALAAVLGCLATEASAVELRLLAQPGPWPAVHALIGYGERLWFSSGVLYENANGADVYSYDPRSGEARYEAHLFSQAAGDPAVVNGVLYWPSEDPRSSTGRGEFMVTDGDRWTWHFLPQGQAFHVHAMAGQGDALYAATSAWRGILQRSDDGGRTWRLLYEHPSPSRTVSRFTELAVLGGAVYSGLTAWREDGTKLFRVTDDGATPVAGWPEGRSVTSLATHEGWLYGANHGDSESRVWRTNGTRVELVPFPTGHRLRHLASDGRLLWAASVGPGEGALWATANGVDWTREHTFKEARPVSVALHGGRVYVGTIGPQGRGGLWGPPPPAPAGPKIEPPPVPEPERVEGPGGEALATGLFGLLADGDALGRNGEALRQAAHRVALAGDPAAGDVLATRLSGPFPASSVRLFGGNVEVSAATIGRWYMMWAMAYGRGGRVPLDLISAPWTASQNRAEKYLESPPMALWAAARLGQDDAATIEAIIDGLGREGDPVFVDGDRVGALTALTGQRFGYDFKAWQTWWLANREGWQRR